MFPGANIFLLNLTFPAVAPGFVGQSRGCCLSPLQDQQQPPRLLLPILPSAEQVISHSLMTPMARMAMVVTLKMTNIAVKTRKEVSEGTASSATPLSKRVYSESSDQEMDIWIQVLTRLHQKLKDQSEFCSWPYHPPTGPDTRRSLSR